MEQVADKFYQSRNKFLAIVHDRAIGSRKFLYVERSIRLTQVCNKSGHVLSVDCVTALKRIVRSLATSLDRATDIIASNRRPSVTGA